MNKQKWLFHTKSGYDLFFMQIFGKIQSGVKDALTHCSTPKRSWLSIKSFKCICFAVIREKKQAKR